MTSCFCLHPYEKICIFFRLVELPVLVSCLNYWGWKEKKMFHKISQEHTEQAFHNASFHINPKITYQKVSAYTAPKFRVTSTSASNVLIVRGFSPLKMFVFLCVKLWGGKEKVVCALVQLRFTWVLIQPLLILGNIIPLLSIDTGFLFCHTFSCQMYSCT